MWQIDSALRPGESNQDRIAVTHLGEANHLIGVFDGHGDSAEVSEFLAAFLIGVACLPNLQREPLSSMFERMAFATHQENDGSTAAVAKLDSSGKVEGAILGDSMILSHSPGSKLFVSSHHNVRTNLEERRAGIERGGKFKEGYLMPRAYEEGLQSGRSFGDKKLKPVISVTPDVFTRKILPGGWLAVMSDGVLDPSIKSFRGDCFVFAEMVERGKSAQEIVDYFQPEKNDDASLILCRFELSWLEKPFKTTTDLFLEH